MCRPVIPKKVAPNSGVAPGQRVAHSWGSANGRRPSSIRCFHSIPCRMTKARPKTIVSKIHLRAFSLSPRDEADTPITIVKLEDNRHRVMIEEKTMLGANGNGVGQTLEART